MSIIWNTYPLSSSPDNFWEQWDTLNKKYCESHPMLQSSFVRLLTEYFPATIDVLAATENGECVALVLVEKTKSLILKCYLPSQTQLTLMLMPSYMADQLDFSELNLPLTILRLDLYSTDPKYQPSFNRSKGVERTHKCTNMVVDIGNDFEGYWAERPRNLRKNISRYMRRIEKDLGGCTLKVVTDRESMSLAVARYGFIESFGWKGQERTALHPGNTQGNFYLSVLESFAEKNSAFVFELWANNQLLGARLCISNGSMLILLKTTFNEEYKKYAIGKVLLYKTLKHIFDTKLVSTVDFYTNATKDQLDWSTQSRSQYDVSIYRSGMGQILKRALTVKSKITARTRCSISHE